MGKFRIERSARSHVKSVVPQLSGSRRWVATSRPRAWGSGRAASSPRFKARKCTYASPSQGRPSPGSAKPSDPKESKCSKNVPIDRLELPCHEGKHLVDTL